MAESLFSGLALDVAPWLLNGHITVDHGGGPVRLRITEVEAYHGVGTPGPYDAGSHARDRQTARNAAMFGPPGHAYVYFTYGMHFALNMVCSPVGVASGILIRSGEIVAGEALARARRGAKRGGSGDEIPHAHLARGPGNVATALGLDLSQNGLSLFADPFAFEAALTAPERVASGPRVGVAGIAGGPEFPWRFWIAGDLTVSAFRPGKGAPSPG